MEVFSEYINLKTNNTSEPSKKNATLGKTILLQEENEIQYST